MPTFREALIDEMRESYCVIAPALNAAIFVAAFSGGGFVPAGLAAGANTVASRLLCNREPPSSVYSAGSAFNGGQCPERYIVQVKYAPSDGVWQPSGAADGGTQAERTVERRVWGPVGPLTVLRKSATDSLGDSAWRIVGFNHGSALNPGNSRLENAVPFEYADQQVVRGAGASVVIRSVTVFRVDLQPDNCGNVERELAPPTPGAERRETDVTYNDNNGNQITVPAVFVIGNAFISAKGELRIPVGIELNGEFNFNGQIDLGTGDIDFDFYTDFVDENGDRRQFPPGDPSGDNRPNNFTSPNPIPSPPGGKEFEDTEKPSEPKREKAIRAVAVTVTSQLPSTLGTIFQPGENPDVIIPDVGFVQFLIRIKESVFWTNAIKVNNQRAFIPCPWEGGALAVAGTPRPGVTWVLNSIYKTQEVDESFLG